MGQHEPATQTVKASDARQHFSQLLNQVFRKETRVIVEKSGIAVAALISADDLARLDRYDRLQSARFRALDATREVFKDVPDDELEAEVTRAVAEARAELRQERAEFASR